MTKNELEDCIRHTNLVVHKWLSNPRSVVYDSEVIAVFKGLLNKHIGYNRRQNFKAVCKNLIINVDSKTRFINNIKVVNVGYVPTLGEAYLIKIEEALKLINFDKLLPNENNLDTLKEVSEISKEINFSSIIKIKF